MKTPEEADAMVREHPFWPLITEIDKLKETLYRLDEDDPNFSVRCDEHAKRIQDAIPPNPGDIYCFIEHTQISDPNSFCEENQYIYCPYPLCRLLNKDEFHPQKIPLSILELLVKAGFDVNVTSKENGETCLHSAIVSGHYNAAKWLVRHGADCNAIDHESIHHKTPIVSLASRPNVPLDLFDLLKTPENLNDGTDKSLPLHEALRHGCIKSALHLISLGADVNKIDGSYRLPVECYVHSASAPHLRERFEFHEELFIRLLPTSCMNTFQIIHNISLHFELDDASKMVYPLLQRHVKAGNISLSVLEHDDKYRIFYLESLLVLLLDLDVAVMPDIAEITSSMTDESWKQVVIDIWEAYDQQRGKVKSLFKLCIQCTRKSMSSLDDDSFQSLEPLPEKIRNSLKLRDVAGVICKTWKLWPKCVSVEDL